MNATDDQIAHQYDIATSELKTMCSRFTELDFGMSGRHNAVFGPNDLLHVVAKMGIDNLSFEGAVAAPNREAAVAGSGGDTHGMARVPTTDFVLSALRRVDPDRAALWAEMMVRCSVRRARRCGMLQGVDTYTIDITDVGYYGKGLDDIRGGAIRATEPPRSSRTSRFTASAVPQTSCWRQNRSPGGPNWPIS